MAIARLSVLIALVANNVTSAGLRTPPPSATNAVAHVDQLDTRVLQPVNIQDTLNTDEIRRRQRPVPYRVAIATPFVLDWQNAGTTEFLPDGSRLWRLRIDAPNAKFISMKFSKWSLPDGATVHFVSVAKDFAHGPIHICPKQSQRTLRFTHHSR